MTRRFAHVWTPQSFDAIQVRGAWPACLELRGWRYWPDLAIDRTPLVRRGARTGSEFVVYRLRASLLDENGLTDVPAPEPARERTRKRGRTADPARQDPTGDRRATRGVYRRR